MAGVKICGITQLCDLEVVANASADFVGFVHFEPSPRHIALLEMVDLIEVAAERKMQSVVLLVDPDARTLAQAVALKPDWLQIHRIHTLEHAQAIRHAVPCGLILAAPIAHASDLDFAMQLQSCADMVLLDAKPPKHATLPGGNGTAFDWQILHHSRLKAPWMRAGGLTPETAAEARATGADILDVSSGVESAPGVKDHDKIYAFVKAAKGSSEMC